MKIRYAKNFDKMFQKLRKNEKTRVNESIFKFIQNPLDPTLRNHALRGKMTGDRAISAGGDLRIIFHEEEDYVIVLMLAVGSHNQVYK
jgi:addiction module RelE/StbE family toxin